jgi:RNA-directed DNA polymerase
MAGPAACPGLSRLTPVAEVECASQRSRVNARSSLLGWSNYFCHGTCRSAFRGVDRYVYERVRDFLARRHKVAGRGTKRFSCDVVYGECGLLRLERLPFTAPSCALR